MTRMLVSAALGAALAAATTMAMHASSVEAMAPAGRPMSVETWFGQMAQRDTTLPDTTWRDTTIRRDSTWRDSTDGPRPGKPKPQPKPEPKPYNP